VDRRTAAFDLVPTWTEFESSRGYVNKILIKFVNLVAVHAVSCELVSCFPVFQGKSRELCWPDLAGSRRRPPKCEYLKQLMAKFPAVNNREFVNADQGIASGYQGRPLPEVGGEEIWPVASCRTSPYGRA
jgi:hypothetical protein